MEAFCIKYKISREDLAYFDKLLSLNASARGGGSYEMTDKKYLSIMTRCGCRYGATKCLRAVFVDDVGRIVARAEADAKKRKWNIYRLYNGGIIGFW